MHPKPTSRKRPSCGHSNGRTRVLLANPLIPISLNGQGHYRRSTARLDSISKLAWCSRAGTSL